MKRKLFFLFIICFIMIVPVNAKTYKVTANIAEYVDLNTEGWKRPPLLFMYCGMINNRVFSIKSNGYRSSVNLYYDKNTQYIYYEGFKLKIIDVNSEYIKFEYRKEK